MTLEEFVVENGLEIVEIETTRTERRFGLDHGLSITDEYTCTIQVPGPHWEMRVTGKGWAEFIRWLTGVSKESREDARKKFTEKIQGTIIWYTPGERALAKKIIVPDNLI